MSLATFATSLFRRNKSKKRVKRQLSFRPRLEGLEERWCPAADYWQPGANSIGYGWARSTNWSLGHSPGTSDVAEFDGTHANSKYSCTLDISPTCQGIDFLNGWTLDAGSNQLQFIIPDSTTLTLSSYFDMAGNAAPEISMGGTASKIYVANTSTSPAASTFNGGKITGSAGLLEVSHVAASGALTFNIADDNICDSNITIDNVSVLVNLNQTGGPLKFGSSNNVIFDTHGEIDLHSAASNLITSSSGSTTNSYINVESDGEITSDNNISVETDIPVLNAGAVYLTGTWKMDGTVGASAVSQTSGGTTTYYDLWNSGGNVYIGTHTTAGTAGAADWKFNCPSSTGCKGYLQTSGTLQVGSDGTGGAQKMELLGASANLGTFKFTGGSVELLGTYAKSLTFASSSSSSTVTATGTSFKFFVKADDTACSQIILTSIACTVDNTDTCYVWNGSQNPNTPKKTLTFLKVGTGASESGLWVWNFDNVSDLMTSNWTGCAAGGGDLTATH